MSFFSSFFFCFCANQTTLKIGSRCVISGFAGSCQVTSGLIQPNQKYDSEWFHQEIATGQLGPLFQSAHQISLPRSTKIRRGAIRFNSYNNNIYCLTTRGPLHHLTKINNYLWRDFLIISRNLEIITFYENNHFQVLRNYKKNSPKIINKI